MGLSAQLLQIARMLFAEETLETALERVMRLVDEVLPGDGCGVTVVEAGRKRTAAHSDELVARADLLQYELDEGPCLSAWSQQSAFRVDDMHQETRWPRWAPAAATLGLQSSLSAPMLARGEPIGAIKVYSREPHAFGASAERALALFAEQAAIALANLRGYLDAKRLSLRLDEALHARDLIGTAKGILMERQHVDEETAFRLLRTASQQSNMKLRDLAAELVERVRGS
jgi:GAF domain-containing protein